MVMVMNVNYQDRVVQYALHARFFYDQLLAKDWPVLQNTFEAMTPTCRQAHQVIRTEIEKALSDKAAEEKLRVEYAHLFLLPEGVKMYASVHQSSEPLLRQKAWQQVTKRYKTHGLKLEPDEYHPEDHASVELSFMAHLIEQGESYEAQLDFLQKHVLIWLPGVLQKLCTHPKAEIYRLVSERTLHFLKEEEQLLMQLMNME
ncbi:TorD/DmsD family molecular chaperone [Anoxynatronum buryatiense]|uniref:Chaperone TorD involved in molybdoenzyme TorA maturation n=1 Tax=Anoxynatronum buryatiense TaxID=489973 RepID=A0AA46AI49_9CLOT|nr:molecular chaperone TorD family protein [Anoxynatronum buryatiense]SMP45361.1 chaperone TorD involved in molybdoenzyme TorA maturation [Anoxynatronum buryatiense]